MSLIPILLLKKAQESRRYTGTKKVREEVKENTVNSSVSYSFGQHINLRIKSEPQLSKFFGNLAKYGQEIDKLDKDKALEEFQNLCETYFENERVVAEKLTAVEKTGVSLTENIKSNSSKSPVLVREGNGFRWSRSI